MTASRAYAQAAEPGNFFVAGKNKIINGDFGIWQRGTSLALSSSYVYLADRFKSTCRNGAGTQSRYSLTAAESAICANLKYAYSFDISTAATNVKPAITQLIEDSWDKYGKTFTVSFYAKASKAVTMDIVADLIWANADNTTSTSVSLTTTFQRFSFTFTLSPSGTYNSATDNFAIFWYTPMNDTYTVYMTGVQVEAGSVATPFTTATGTLAGELAACERYFKRNLINDGISGFCDSSTKALYAYTYPTMRVAPTLSVTAASFRIRYSGGSVATATAFTLDTSTTSNARFDVTVASGLTSGQGVILNYNGSGGYFDLSSEL